VAVKENEYIGLTF